MYLHGNTTKAFAPPRAELGWAAHIAQSPAGVLAYIVHDIACYMLIALARPNALPWHSAYL